MMETKNQTGSKKKLLVPVVVLMLCLVGLAGAAYAYSSTLTNTGNEANAGMLSIDLKQNGQAVASDAVVPGTEKIVVFTDNFGYTAQASKTNWIAYEIPASVVVVTYKVNIAREEGNTGTVDLTIGTDNLMADAAFSIGGTAKTVADIYDVKVNVDSAGAVAIAQVGQTTEWNTTVSNIALGEHVVVITFEKKTGQGAPEATGYTTAARFTMGSQQAPEDETAEECVTTVGDIDFTLTFKAEPHVANP